MHRIYTFILLGIFNFITLLSPAQTFAVKGKLVDGDSSMALGKGSIKIAPAADSSKGRSMVADSSGVFQITDVAPGNYLLVFSFTGYDNGKKNIAVKDTTVDLSEVMLFRKQGALNNVTVIGRTPPARQKGDTTELNASAFKVNPDATTEDLLKKAPGITVENGVVTAQGEEVKKVTIDGRQFFGDDATAALKNLPAEVVDKIQVFDRMSDQAQLTGFDDGNAVKSINIVTKANMRNGQFGRIYAGYGTDERYAAGASVNLFSGNKRINLIGLFNNINQQNFSGEDLLGVSGAANTGRGNQGNTRGGGGNRGGGSGGNANNFQIGPQPGIARTNAAGINFSDLWLNKKMEFTGSYFFNNSRTTTKTITNRELFLPGDTSQFYKENRIRQADNSNHRINMRVEYKIDSNNTLIVAPNLSFQSNKSQSEQFGANTTSKSFLINSTGNQRVSVADGYNLRNDITFRHAFAKRGRAVTISLSSGINHRTSDVNLDAVSAYYDTATLLINDTLRQRTNNLTKGYNLSPSVNWSEPLGKKGQLQFSYNYQYNKNNADQENYFFDKVTGKYSLFDTSLSNLFENTVKANNAGISYRIGDQVNQFSAGLNYQGTVLNSDQQFPVMATVHKSYSNWLPNIQYRRNFGKQANLRLMYRASVNAPSVNQLQNVINNSNPLFITTGNPYLNQSYRHFLTARYNITNTQKGTSFFAGIFSQFVNDYITNATYIAGADSLLSKDVVLRKGAQLSKPVNLSGYRNIRGFVTYGIAIKPLKSNLNFNAGINYSRTPGLVNYVQNFSNNYSYNAGITIASNISEYIDFNVNYSANFNRVVNSIQSQLNNKYYYHNAGIRLNLLTKSGWFLLNDVTNQLYSGLADGYNQSFWLWNTSAGKKFFKNKRGELKLTVFDLLKQNQSIARNVTDNYIEDVQTDVLQQYFMLTFTYTLRNFGHPPARNSSRRYYGGEH